MEASTDPGARGWRFAGALVLSLLFWLIAWYWDTADTMVAIWRSSETFAHGFIIVPISAWLIWRRRHVIAALHPRPEFRVLPLIGIVGFGWLFARFGGVGVVQQYAFALMIPLLVWALLGNQVARAVAFPLLFVLFAVPFGESLQPPLMDYTADFTVAALRLSGIPVYREGLFFTIPSGSWSVVEACSGLRYLMASLTLGVLYAYLTYRSALRRAVFIVVSILVPIVANWLRAYMIVMIGHLSSMRLAVGVDHLIYGWLFFGVVVMLLFWIGSFWREDLDAEPHSHRDVKPEPALQAWLPAASLAAALMVAIWPQIASFADARRVPGPLALQSPQPSAGWQSVSEGPAEWSPRFQKPRAQLEQVFVKDGMRAGLYIGYYRDQGPGEQLISSENVLVASGDSKWKNAGELGRAVNFDAQPLPLIEAKLRSGENRLLVWRFYWIDGEYVVSPYLAKLLQARSKLFGNGDDGAVVIVYTPYDRGPEPAERALRDFLRAMLPGLKQSLEDARRV